METTKTLEQLKAEYANACRIDRENRQIYGFNSKAAKASSLIADAALRALEKAQDAAE